MYFLGRISVVVGHGDHDPGLAAWREHLFTLMRRNATSAADWFRLPPERVVELATRLEL